MGKPISVAVIGSGLIGRRRADSAQKHPRSRVVSVVDQKHAVSESLANQLECRSSTDWKETLQSPEVDAVTISTPNGFLAEIAIAALKSGKHVLVEKPMGRNLKEAQEMAAVAKSSGKILKIGFNHRYHPAIAKTKHLLSEGAIGKIINIRARYGHGGRPGYEKEWRGNPQLAGGGELTDQGVHIVDLLQWFAGMPDEAFAFLQTAVWPIQPLEDNAFGLFRYKNGMVASLHTSWTQWKNLFSFEIFGTEGSLTIEGLGQSYGTEKLIKNVRNMRGGVPAVSEEVYDGPDSSWSLEWNDFINAIDNNMPFWGTPKDGVRAMQMIEALYQSAQQHRPITIEENQDEL
ncbi:MAG: Gfo/Idh/MocA family oxidoreductase [Deltaproteobacteria bacterium]|nr:Gfo/Idh/MocA family oxidoreductase [Deltaproteobacteria bacterium]